MIIAELSKLLDEIKATREKMYPPDWDYDPLFRVEKELELLLQEMREKRPT